MCWPTSAVQARTPYPLLAGTPQPNWVLPRQSAAFPLHASTPALLSGVSAFAFQGTNAHAVLEQPGSSANTSRLQALAWAKDYHWVAPEPHVMLHSVHSVHSAPARKALALECRLSATPRLAFFWDHRVSGKALFPGAGFLELAVAAAKVAAGARLAAQAAVAGVAIPSPLPLPDRFEQQQPVGLRCSIQLASGALEVSSSAGGYKQPHISANAAATLLLQPPATSATAPGRSIVARLLAAAAAQPQPAAFASVDNSQSDSTTHFHPASLDSCLQLAAAAAAGTGLKVPAGLEALHLPEPLAEPGLSAASCERSASASASVVDYWLAEGSSRCGGLAVHALSMKALIRPAGAAHGAQAQAAAAASPEELLYEVCWPVAGAAAAAVAAQPLPAAARVSSVRLPGGADGVSAAARAVQALQQAHQHAPSGAQLSTVHALPVASGLARSSRAPGAAHGALHGMLRTVALETQGQTFESVDHDGLSTSAPTPHLVTLQQQQEVPLALAGSGGAYGAALRCGAAYLAALLPSRARSSLQPFSLFPRPRGAIANLAPQPVSVDRAAPGQVVLAVKAVGINFR